MFQIHNKTPYPSGLAFFLNAQGAEQVTVVSKATFQLPTYFDSECVLSAEQRPILYCDEYFAEPGRSSLHYPADVVLGKYTTDVGIIGHVHSPSGRPASRVRASLVLGDLRKDIDVHGDRTWRANWSGGFSATVPEPFVSLPIRYERSFGGTDITDDDPRQHAAYPPNPIGTGFRQKRAAVAQHPLPNFEEPNQEISCWEDRPPPAGYGFIAPSWSPRCLFAGTYDTDWQTTRAPLLPKDFDLRFCQASPPSLQTRSFLTGGETVKLTNLSRQGNLSFSLPKLVLRYRCRIGISDVEAIADLWTVVFEPDAGLVCMVFGKAFPIGKQPARMRFVEVEQLGLRVS